MKALMTEIGILKRKLENLRSLATLKKDVDALKALKKEVDTLKAGIRNLNRLKALEKEVETLRTGQKALEKEVEFLKTQLKPPNKVQFGGILKAGNVGSDDGKANSEAEVEKAQEQNGSWFRNLRLGK